MAESLRPSKEEMRRAAIVLSDALPYELVMLDIAARYTQKPQFKQLEKDKKAIDWLTHNATVEAFWTHARCLIDVLQPTQKRQFRCQFSIGKGFYPWRLLPL